MDKSKNAILIGVMVFCLVVIVFQWVLNSGEHFGWLKMFGGIVLAAIAGGGTFVAMGGAKG